MCMLHCHWISSSIVKHIHTHSLTPPTARHLWTSMKTLLATYTTHTHTRRDWTLKLNECVGSSFFFDSFFFILLFFPLAWFYSTFRSLYFFNTRFDHLLSHLCLCNMHCEHIHRTQARARSCEWLPCVNNIELYCGADVNLTVLFM